MKPQPYKIINKNKPTATVSYTNIKINFGSNTVDPDNLLELSRKANQYYKNKHYQEALILYKKILDNVPFSIITLETIASILIQLGRHEEASVIYEELARISPSRYKEP